MMYFLCFEWVKHMSPFILSVYKRLDLHSILVLDRQGFLCPHGNVETGFRGGGRTAGKITGQTLQEFCKIFIAV